MYKTNEHYIEEMIRNIDFILLHMSGITKEGLEANEVLSDSMIFRLIQISELSKKLTDEYKSKHDCIPWGDIIALRNRLVHDYGNVDMSIVYDTLTKDIGELRSELNTLL